MTSEPIRIVHVIYRLAVGGLENGLVNLMNGLPQDAWQHTIVALTDIDTTFAQRIRAPNVDLVALHKRAGNAVGVYLPFWRLLRRVKPAIVHTRNLAALELTPVACAAGVRARVHGEHGWNATDASGHNVGKQRIRRLYRPFVSRYVAVSAELESYLTRSIGVAPALVERIVNGVDTARFAAPVARMQIEGCPFGEVSHVLVGSVGRLDAVKDHANLARAFVAAIARQPGLRERLRVVFVGDGIERLRIERTLADGNASSLAWFAGERHDIAHVLQGLDVFVLPSYGEGVSNTILEAMATGLPVVATDVGANPELVIDDVTGCIVPAADSDALAAAIVKYANDPSRRANHGREGRARAEQRYSVERMIERYHRLYSAVAKRKTATDSSPVSAAKQHAPH